MEKPASDGAPVCFNGLCQNGGTCLVQRHLNRTIPFCQCPLHFTGPFCEKGARCEVNIDECASDPCQNSGRCIDGQNQYRCLCPDGFIGLNCEINTDECMSAPCLHGRCQDGPNMYSCLCEQGWTGLGCEENIDDCAFSPCQNGGICVDLIDKFACFCPDGFTGKTCENDINVCKEAAQNASLCLNGATCLDGKGPNFTCSCPPGFTGDFCEVDFNECYSAPCHNGGICQDLINSYVCHCRSGWTGLHCEDDINECLPQPCDRGICIQNDPGYGYTCFCRPGFVGKNCEHNYDDCLSNPCPPAFSCVDGVNAVSCLPPSTDAVPLTTNITSSQHTALSLTPTAPRSTANVQYLGNSFLEFDGIDLSAVTNITVRFQTRTPRGTLLYMDQGPANIQFFFIKLFILDGVLKYVFSCNEEDDVILMNTSIQVNDDKVHLVNIRQHLTPCEAELTLSGYGTIKSPASNYWLGYTQQSIIHVHVGGLPLRYTVGQKAQPFDNFTGCIEIIEMNKRRSFYTSDAIANSNTWECRKTIHLSDTFPSSLDISSPPLKSDSITLAPQMEKPASDGAPVCFNGLCQNGGTCFVQRHLNRTIPFCQCPLHFTGPFCEKDATVFIPRFDVNSYLELPPLASLLPSSGDSNNLPITDKDTTVILQLTVKTRSTQGTILYSQTQNFGEQYVHVFLEDGSPVVKLSCGSNHVLVVTADQSVNIDKWVNLTVRYNLPVGKLGGSCMIEIAVDNGPAQHLEEYVSHPVSEGTFGPIFLGALSSHWEMLGISVKAVQRFMGCIGEFWVNSKEVYLVGEGTTGRNIMNCEPLVCQLLPCRNGGTCVSSDEDWFCDCPPQYTGRLCQLSACERSPCAHGATCIPKSPLEAVCLCPFGRQGLLCDQVVNITRPRFGGNDEFDYTSFLAYTSVPSLAFFYEFKLKFILANNSSAVKDNLILFAGYKGQGNHGDDFLALGIKSGRVVHRFNLGSGVATIVSDRLDPRIPIHTVAFGRAKKTGWLQVDGQRNRTGSSRGPLVGLGVFHQLFMGGYNEYTPELLPLGSRFRHGFQGCIFDVQFRTGGDRKFQVLGQPEGQPLIGRSVGQCGVTPCAHVFCENGGTCMDSGSSVYCQCPFGWKGALCSETVSVCDEEHNPPPLCAHGSTCIALPNGYTCYCPLGTAGLYCDKAVAITDPFFSGNQSSWMSFAPLSLRHRAVMELQFQPLAPDGILVYTAQHLNTRAGDFFCLSLTSGHVQLRYNLGDGTHVLQSVARVDLSGMAWHRVRAGRVGHRGFLSLDNKETTHNTTSQCMSTLDVATDFFVGGVSSLSLVAPDATEGAPMGFTGGLRGLTVNGLDLDLSERGAVSGANVGDWDGTACGYKVCQNQGRCSPIGTDSFMCSCPPDWTGPLCNQSAACVNNNCNHGSFCSANNTTSYQCLCSLGWTGRLCDVKMSTDTFQFMGKSYIKYFDPRQNTRNLKHTKVSFSFMTFTNNSLIMWMGRAEHEDEDYLAIGLENGHIKIAVNLGERLPQPIRFENVTLCCNRWHSLSITLNTTVIQVLLNNQRVINKNIDLFEQYVALNYGGWIYFGGFELNRNVQVVTSGLFSKGYEGSLRNVYLYNDIKPLQFLPNSEGFNVYDGNKQS